MVIVIYWKKIGPGEYPGQSYSSEFLVGSALGVLRLNEECGTAVSTLSRE